VSDDGGGGAVIIAGANKKLQREAELDGESEREREREIEGKKNDNKMALIDRSPGWYMYSHGRVHSILFTVIYTARVVTL
jgi:hypothetical protein